MLCSEAAAMEASSLTSVSFLPYGGFPVSTRPLFLVVILLIPLYALPISAEEYSFASEPATSPVTHHYDRFGIEEPNRRAQASFIAGQAMHGALLGLQVTSLSTYRDFVPVGDEYGNVFHDTQLRLINAVGFVAGPVLGATSALAYSHLTDITPGRSSAKNFGTQFGGASAMMLYMAIDDDPRRAPPLLTMMGGQFAGLAAGRFLGRSLGATSADISLIRTTSTWSPLLFAGTYLYIFDREPSSKQLSRYLLGTTSMGALGGTLLTSRRPVAKSRLRLINGAGFFGALAGMAVGRELSSSDSLHDDRRRAERSGATIGAVAGLGTAFALTASFDDPDRFSNADSSTSTSFGITPADEDGGFQATLQGSF